MDAQPCTPRRREADATFYRQPKEHAPELLMRVKSKRKPAEKSSPASAVQIGAARALDRLEAEEAGLFAAYEKAKAGKDALEIKIARDAWLKTSESLRKFDLLVAAARREVGELVPRADVARWLENIGGAIYFALYKTLYEDRRKIFKTLDDAFSSSIQRPGDKLRYPCEEVPQWCYHSLFLKRAGRGDSVDALILRYQRRAVIIDAMDRFSDDRDKLDAFLREEFKKDQLRNHQKKETPA
jgi:hypothetical protein